MTVQHEYSVSEGTKHCIIFTASLTFLFPGSQCDMYNSELLLKVLGGGFEAAVCYLWAVSFRLDSVFDICPVRIKGKSGITLCL